MTLSSSDAVRIYTKWLPNLRITSNKVKICSPFRAETNPSFEISLENGLWYDYGAGSGGDIILFISMYENISIKEALIRYEEIMNGSIVKPLPPTTRVYSDGSKKLGIYRREFLENIHKWDSDVFKDRGISEHVFVKYGGYMWKENNIQRVLLSFNGSNDEIIDRYKMWIWKNGKKMTYTRGPVTLYPLSELRHNELVLCEGEFDCLSVLSNGYNAITGTGGATTFKEEWAWALSKKKLCVVYDADPAGDNGALLVSEVIKGYAKSVFIHKWIDKPDHYDVGDYIKNNGDLNEIIRFK